MSAVSDVESSSTALCTRREGPAHDAVVRDRRHRHDDRVPARAVRAVRLHPQADQGQVGDAMGIALTQDQRDFAAAVREFTAKYASITRTREEFGELAEGKLPAA